MHHGRRSNSRVGAWRYRCSEILRWERVSGEVSQSVAADQRCDIELTIPSKALKTLIIVPK